MLNRVLFFCSAFQRLAQLDGAEVVSRADNKSNRPDYLRQLDDACSAPSTLKLKVGAQVCGFLKRMEFALIDDQW